MSHAHTFDIEAAYPEIPTQFNADSSFAIPIANELEITGLTVDNATNSTPLFTSGSGNTITANIQVGAAITGAPADKNDAGLVSFNDTQFSVDSNGYVSILGGELPIDSFSTDVAGPVGADGAGNIDITGTNIYTDGTVANTITLNVQATSNTFLIGAGSQTSMTELGPLTNGQLIIGSTGLAPAVGSLASADSSITITPSAGGIDLAVYRDLSPATFVVDATASEGTHTTIASAIAAASSGDTIFIRPGTYTEDFTVKGGLTIFGAQPGFSGSQTKIVGKITHTEATETTWSNIYFETNADYLYSITGTNAVVATFRNCSFVYSDNDAIEINNANSSIKMFNCIFVITANSLKLFTVTTCTLFEMFYCFHSMSGVTLLTASTIAAGTFRTYFCDFDSISFAASGTSNFQARKSMFFTSNENVTILTTSGTGGNHQAQDCTFASGTAVAISIGSGTTFQFLGSNNINSSNASPISGAGAIFSYDLITFSGGGNTIGIAPTNPRYTALQRLSLNEGSDYMSENLIKSVSPDTSDAAYLASVAATDWTWGIDNSVTSPTVDPWVLSQGTALGTNNVMSVATSGEINYPLQPSCLATLSAGATNVTGDGTQYTLSWGTEIYDQNNDLSGTTFTAPVTGRYQFNSFVRVTGLTSSHVTGNFRLITSNRTYINNNCSPWACADGSTNYTFQFSMKADMDASDTATLVVTVGGGTLVVDIDTNTYLSVNLEE